MKPIVTRAEKFRPINRCIYCGSVDAGLRVEHIIPFGIGGRLELPAASCDDCAKETHAFEGRCLSKMFGGVRAHLGMRSRKRGNIETAIVEVVDPLTGISCKDELQASIHALSIATIRFDPAGALMGMPAEDFQPYIISELIIVPDYRLRMNRLSRMYPGQVVFSAGPVRAMDYGRLLAKIAHSYAHAQNALGGFNPELPELILRGDGYRLQQCVGVNLGTDRPADELHSISLDTRQVGVRTLLVAQIKLFAGLAMPVHNVIVGANPPLPLPPPARP